MASIKKVILAQRGGVQSALSSAHRTPAVDALGSTGIEAEVVARPWPAVLEDAGALLPLARQGRVHAIGNQITNMST